MSSYVVIEFVANWAGEPPADAPPVTCADPPKDHGVAACDTANPPSSEIGIPSTPIWRF